METGNARGGVPRVSVVMTVYNAMPFLRRAVESILGQSFAGFEFLIVDDASTDEGPAFLRSLNDPRVRLFFNPVNRGIVSSANRGLSEAAGEYVARMDADDVSYPDRLQRQVEFLDLHREVTVCGAAAEIIDGEGRVLRVEMPPTTPGEIQRRIFTHNPFVNTSVLVRRQTLEEVGGYDPRFRHNEDYDLWLRIGSRYKLANLPEVLVQRRIYGGNVTVVWKRAMTGYRVRTLANAIFRYYHQPQKSIYLARPVAAYLARSLGVLLSR